jgi:Fanconi anemia group J protein
MLGVCRGKLSEGIDFSDDAARCVIMVGIPYPNMSDPYVIMKKHHLESKRANSGWEWYN